MSRELLLGIDLGTQSVRVALLDLDGQIVALAAAPQVIEVERPGWAAQDPDAWWAATVSGIRQVLAEAGAQPGDILAVGADAQMHAAIPLSRSGELLSHSVPLWCDKRAAGLVRAFESDAVAARAMQLAANPPLAAWVGFKIRWLRENEPNLYHRTWKVVTGASFVNQRLTGEVAVDWSEASGFFLLDAERMAWSEELAGCLDVGLDKLPPLMRSSEIVGRVTADAGRLTGLAPGTPVVAGAGDMLCMLLAAGLTQPGQAVDISGTASDFCVFSERPVLDPPIQNLHHAVAGWVPFGIVESGGGALQWLKNELAGIEREQAALAGANPYEVLDVLASDVPPGSDGLLFMPYLMGERILGTPYARGALVGITPRTGVGAMARAVMEGVCFELRRTLEIAERAGAPVTSVFTTGGGARSNLWSQIKADIYERPVRKIEASEGGVVGSAILAGVGAGVFADAEAGVARWVRTDRVFEPDPTRFARYRAMYEVFRDVHDRLQQPFEDLAHVP